MDLTEALEKFLSDYPRLSGEEFSGHEFHNFKNKVKEEISDLDIISDRENLEVRVGVGQNTWTYVPWIGFLDTRETDTPQRGVYVVYLFSADMSGVYLTINQGYWRFEENGTPTEARRLAQESAENLRSNFEELDDFNFENEIDLKSDASTPKGYEATTIGYKFYEADDLPEEDELRDDLERALESYSDYVSNDDQLKLEREDFEKIGDEDGNKEVIEKLEKIGNKIIEDLPEPIRNELNSYETPWNVRGSDDPKDYLFIYFDTQEDNSKVHPELLIKTNPNRVILRLNAGQKGKTRENRDIFVDNISDHKEEFDDVLENMSNFLVDYKYHSHEINSEELENVKDEFIDNIETYGMTKSKIIKDFTEEDDIYSSDFIDTASQILREKIFPSIAFINEDFSPKYLELLPPDGEPSLKGKKTALAHLVSGKNIIFYGPPGTGKTELSCELANSFCGKDNYTLVTANGEWTTYDVKGGQKVEGGFRDGFLTEAVKKDVEPYWLIIDEINRANLDLAFGEAFTLLDIEYREKKPLVHEEERDDGAVKIPESFRILGTMNSYDKALLHKLGYAFRRRFAFVEIPSSYGDKKTIVYKDWNDDLEENWEEFSDIESDWGFKKEKIQEWIGQSEKEDIPLIDSLSDYLNYSDFPKELKEKWEKIEEGEWDSINPINILLRLAHEITKREIVEFGHAQVKSASQFLLAYLSLLDNPEEKDIIKAVDEAVVAYYVPQLEHILPEIRKEKSFEGGGRAQDKLDSLSNEILKDLGLNKSIEKVEKLKDGESPI